MNENDLKHIIEATLLAAGRPVPTQQLIDLFDERERPTTEQVKHALDLLAADYAERGIEVIEVASGWRIQVRPRVSDVVSRLWQERPSRYSRALLETLALVAYRQPITRSEIEEIRGVAISSTIMRTLQERNWIRVVGHREVPGRPELLGTTREFLDYFGLKSLDQLPTLAELKDVETIGVQLELPAGEVPASADTADTAEGAQNTGADAQPATDANSTEAQSGAAEAESAAEAQSAGEAESGAEEEPAVEAASVAGEEPAVEAESGAEAESAVEAASVAGEEPAVEAESVAEAESAVEAASAAEDESVVETEPAAEAESATELESSAAEPEVLADADEDNERDSETADDDESHASPTMVAASEEDRTEILEPVE